MGQPELATLAALATFNAAFAAPMPHVTVDVQRIDKDVEPVPMIERFTFEAKDGMLLRDGRPFYWISDGNECGGVHATPLGLWLSKLHGTTLASVLHSSTIVRGSERAQRGDREIGRAEEDRAQKVGQ